MRTAAMVDCVLASCAGSALAAALHAWAWPALPGVEFYDVKLLFSLAGGLPLGLLAAAVAVPWAWRRAGARGAGVEQREDAGRSAALRVSLLVGLAGVAGAWIFAGTGTGMALHLALLAGALIGVFAPLPFALPRSVLRAGGLAGLALAAGLVLGVGSSDRLDVDGFVVERDRTALPAAAPDAPAGQGPDVLLVSVDTLRADAILDPTVPLPHIRALRERARRADYGRAPAPSTLPSHVTMVTGAHPLETGCYTNTGTLPASGHATLAEVFREAGWRAAGVAANALLDEHTGFTRGFEAFSNVVRTDPRVARITELVISTRRMALFSVALSDPASVGVGVLLARRRTNVPERADKATFTADAPLVERVSGLYLEELYADARPFFFFLHFMDPHLPYAPAAASGVTGRLSAASALPSRYGDYENLTTMFADEVRRDLRHGDAAARADAESALRHARLVYHEELMAVDASLGALLARIERSGRPCLVLFTSDHGEHFGEHDLTGHGNSLYEELLRVPFFLAGPGIEPGEFDEAPRLEDVPLTLLHAAGLRPRGGMGRGRDLLADYPGPREAHAAHETEFAVLDGAWKARFGWNCADPRHGEMPALSLVDLVADPAEALDRAATDAAALERLRALASAARSTATPRLTRSMSEEERRSLAELGYVFDEAGNVVSE